MWGERAISSLKAIELPREDPGARWASEWQAATSEKVRGEIFEQIFDTYAPRLRAFFSAKGADREESWDLLQECLVRIHQGLGSFAWKSRFETWLFTIATNTLLNHRRGRRTLKRGAAEVSLEHLLEASPSVGFERALADGRMEEPLHDMLEEERSRLLREALEELPPQMRRCVQLRVQDLRYREIAEILKVSIDTVKAHLYQARQLLKTKLGDYYQIDL